MLLQQKIIRKIDAVDQLTVKVNAEIARNITNMQKLKASILDSAFKGEI